MAGAPATAPSFRGFMGQTGEDSTRGSDRTKKAITITAGGKAHPAWPSEMIREGTRL